MLLKQHNQKVVTSILFTGLLTLLLASCGSGSAIESLVRADPKLTEGETNQESNNASPEPSQSSVTTDEADTSDTPQSEEATESSAVAVEDEAIEPETPTQNLPADFPPDFPIYPQSELTEIETEQDTASGTISWSSPQNRKAIADYYQAQLIANDWEIVEPFTLNPQRKVARIIAVKDEQRVALTLLQSGEENTNLSVTYQPRSPEAESDISQAINSQETGETNPESKIVKPSQSNKLDSSPDLLDQEQIDTFEENDDYLVSPADFADLDEVSEPLSQPIETVAALGILTPYTGEGNVELSKFAPNKVITRGEYARWLIAANNRYYEDDPGKKIYIANNSDRPAFQDINTQHPDFGAIQSLSDAGLIPSRLTQDSTNLLFRPDAPLTREDLVTWKVPLDMRQALPKASIEAIEESWGFQDATEIDSSAIRALYADFQNGDRSNVRRVFGFTTLFQPKKPVTRAEAAASLWYFGFQGDGITAREVLETETETEMETQLDS